MDFQILSQGDDPIKWCLGLVTNGSCPFHACLLSIEAPQGLPEVANVKNRQLSGENVPVIVNP